MNFTCTQISGLLACLRSFLVCGVLGSLCWCHTALAVVLDDGTPDPNDANLRLWLSAGAGVTGTNNVTEWADQSSNGFVFSTATGPELVPSVAAINNQPALRFNQPDLEFLDGPAGVFNGPASTTFIVAQTVTPPVNFTFLYDTGADRHNAFFDNRGGVNQGYGFNHGGSNFTNPNIVYDDTFKVLFARSEPTSTVSRINGVVPGTGNFTGSGQQGGTNGVPFRIGARNASPNANNYFNADFVEFLIYDRALTLEEENAVGYYLEQKYGIDTSYVPEPSTCMLLLCATLACVLKRTYQRRA